METRTGNQLHPDDRAHVLRAYVHRMTAEAQQQWPEHAAYMKANGWRMPTTSDAEWLKQTRFAVRRDGRLDKRYQHCNPF
jgi:hypothetical protein